MLDLNEIKNQTHMDSDEVDSRGGGGDFERGKMGAP